MSYTSHQCLLWTPSIVAKATGIDSPCTEQSMLKHSATAAGAKNAKHIRTSPFPLARLSHSLSHLMLCCSLCSGCLRCNTCSKAAMAAASDKGAQCRNSLKAANIPFVKIARGACSIRAYGGLAGSSFGPHAAVWDVPAVLASAGTTFAVVRQRR